MNMDRIFPFNDIFDFETIDGFKGEVSIRYLEQLAIAIHEDGLYRWDNDRGFFCYHNNDHISCVKIIGVDEL